MLKLYSGLKGYWRGLSNQLTQLAYRYTYATGSTPFAAKCLAKQQLNKLTDDPDQIQQMLNASSLRFTELDSRLQQQLARLGIHTLGQLLALSAAELARRFDSNLLSYLGRLTGDFYHALDYIQPAAGFSRYLELLYEISDTAVLCAPLNSLLQQLEQQLQRRNSLCYQLQLSLYFRQADTRRLAIGSAQGEYRAAGWLKLCQLQLQRLTLPEPVYALQLEVAQYSPQQPQSNDLFQLQQPLMSTLQLVSLLQARLGRSAVVGVVLQDSHAPEQASAPGMPLLQGHTSPVPALPLRPGFLLPQPAPLTEQVELHAGPERLAVAGELVNQRDYFIARNAKGQWLWLYRTVNQHWFVHGLFS